MNKDACTGHKHTIDADALTDALRAAKRNGTSAVLHNIGSSLGTALNIAIDAGDLDCAQLLIEAGACIDYAQLNYHGNVEAACHVQAALMYYNLPVDNLPGQHDVLHYFFQDVLKCTTCDLKRGTEDVRKLVYGHHIRQAVTPLICAIKKRNIVAAEFVLSHNPSLNTDCGAWGDYEHVNPVEIAILENIPEIVSLCLRTKAFDINQSISRHVLKGCKPECLRVLLKAGLHVTRLKSTLDIALAAGVGGPGVPALHQEDKPLSLKFVARHVIRKQLLRANKRNLFCTVSPSTLHLPKALCRYILCEFELP